MKYKNSICMIVFLITLIQSLTVKINDGSIESTENLSPQDSIPIINTNTSSPPEKKPIDFEKEEKLENFADKTAQKESNLQNLEVKVATEPVTEVASNNAAPTQSTSTSLKAANLSSAKVQTSQLRKTKETDEELLAKYSFENVKYVKEISPLGKITLEKKEE